MMMLHRVRRCAANFDLIHFHTDYLHFPLFADCWDKTLTTLHGRLDLPDLPVIMREFSMMPLISISAAQQAPLPWANWYGTVQHGLPTNLHRLGSAQAATSPFSVGSLRKNGPTGPSRLPARPGCRCRSLRRLIP
jgi:hypothetical protein